jgi:hypothetical protein
MRGAIRTVILVMAVSGAVGAFIPASGRPIGDQVHLDKVQSSKAGQRGQGKMSKEGDHPANINPPVEGACDHVKLLDDSGIKADNCHKNQQSAQGDNAKVSSIGEARLEADGSITLNLRSDGTGAAVNGRFTYKPTDKDYKDVVKHLNGIKPGEVKQVPPWPDATK